MPSRLTPLKAKYQYLRNHSAFRAAPVVTTMRLVSWWGHCALGLPGSVKLKRYDARLDLPRLWRGVAKLLYAFREKYEPELGHVAATLSPGMTVVDVGASYGVYTAVAAKAVGSGGLVLAFEPAAESFAVLEHNVLVNGLRNVRLFRCALSNMSGETRLYHHPDSSRNSLGADCGTPSTWEEVRVRTLDSVLEEQGVNCVDLLKIDTEGAEQLVLAGAESLLRRCKPIVVFEVNPAASTALDLHKWGAWSVLDALGYRFFSVNNQGEPVSLDSPGEGGNVLAMHGGSK
jgi:FkbM family methyltransferase